MKARRPGLTLLEALLGLTIVSLVVMGILSVYTTGQRYFMDESVLGEAMEESRYPFAWLARDVKTALGVAAAWGSHTTSAGTLVLDLPSVDGNGIIIDTALLGEHVDHVIYRIFNGKLQRIYDAKEGTSGRVDSSRYLADNLVGLTFTYYDDEDAALASGFAGAVVVKAQIDVRQRGVGSRFFNQSLDSKFKLRNK